LLPVFGMKGVTPIISHVPRIIANILVCVCRLHKQRTNQEYQYAKEGALISHSLRHQEARSGKKDNNSGERNTSATRVCRLLRKPSLAVFGGSKRAQTMTRPQGCNAKRRFPTNKNLAAPIRDSSDGYCATLHLR
jgi:hypothetical protein